VKVDGFQFVGDGTVASDVRALARQAYEVLCGRPPGAPLVAAREHRPELPSDAEATTDVQQIPLSRRGIAVEAPDEGQ
jgi:hypothetical protein